MNGYFPAVGLTNEQVYQLIKISEGKLPMLLHPKQLEYVIKRLKEEGLNDTASS